MKTIDDETVAAEKNFITRQVRAGKQKADRRHKGNDEYTDGMIEHDGHVGELLKLLDDLGVANNTIVQYSTDNGPHFNA